MLAQQGLRAMRIALNLSIDDASRVVGEYRSAVQQQEAAGTSADRQYHRQAMTACVKEAVRLADAGAAPTGRGERDATYVFELRTGLGLSLRGASSIVGLLPTQLQVIETPRDSGSPKAQASVWTGYVDWFVRRQRRLARIKQVPIYVSPETAERRALELLGVDPSKRGRTH